MESSRKRSRTQFEENDTGSDKDSQPSVNQRQVDRNMIPAHPGLGEESSDYETDDEDEDLLRHMRGLLGNFPAAPRLLIQQPMDRKCLIKHAASLILLMGNQILLSCAVVVLYHCRKLHRHQERKALRERIFSVFQARREEIVSLTRHSDGQCIEAFKMDMNAFAVLCELLRTKGGLVPKGQVGIEEQVATFVHMLAHPGDNRFLQDGFGKSDMAFCWNSVMYALLQVHEDLLAKPEPIAQGSTDSKWKWFKGCLGALDGCYIDVTVPDEDKPRYRTRNGHFSTNVLGVCDRNMNFVNMLVGWEGSASDMRVLRDAVSRPHGLQVPVGNYYLVDGRYTNSPGFLAPYRGVRYHLKDWTKAGSPEPENYKEFFNMKHAEARLVIDRAFGLLKRRWPILGSPSDYPVRIQGQVIMACCFLHNFIRSNMTYDPEDSTPLMEEHVSGQENPGVAPEYIDTTVRSTAEWTAWRDALAQEMFDEWRRNTHM